MDSLVSERARAPEVGDEEENHKKEDGLEEAPEPDAKNGSSLDTEDGLGATV